MVAIQIILMLISVICWTALLFASVIFEEEKPNNKTLYYIGFVVGSIISYLGLYYSLLLNGDPIQKFVAGLINYILIILKSLDSNFPLCPQ